MFTNLRLVKIQYTLLVLILLTGFFVRLYRFNNPIADWHSWRQADTSAVSRNFIKFGFDVLHPRFDDLSNVPSGLDNPNGYRFVEFPIYNIFQAGLFKFVGILTIEEWGRLVTIFATLAATVFLFLLVKKYADIPSALLTAFFYVILPYNIYYGRTILPDPSAVTAILGAIYFFDKSLEEKVSSIIPWGSSKYQVVSINNLYFLLSILFTSTALLLKPYTIFFTVPMFYLIYKKWSYKFLFQWKLWVFAILSLLPFVCWRIWMTQYPVGIPVSDWLFNGGNIRFKGAFFYWIFADRVGRLILGYWGIGIYLCGFLMIAKKHITSNALFFLSFLISSLLYVTAIARGNVQHDYYQIYVVPSLAVFLGLGASFLLALPKEYFNTLWGFVILIIFTAFSLFFGWYFVRDYFNINNSSIIAAGVAVDRLTPKTAKVIANYNGDTSFLYQTKRQGWASFEKPLPEMVQMGADYLVLANPTAKDLGIGNTYKILAQTPQYVIFDLHQRP